MTEMSDISRLTRLLTVLGEPGSIGELLDRTVGTLAELFAADLVALVTPGPSETCVVLAALGLREDDFQEPLALTPGSPLAEVLRGGDPVRGVAIGDDPRFQAIGAQAGVWLPMDDSDGGVVGALLLARRAPEPFSDDEVALLGSMARRISLAVAQAQRSAQLEHLAHAAGTIGRQLEDSAIMRQTIEVLPDVLQANAASIFLFGGGADGFRAVDHHGLNEREQEIWQQAVLPQEMRRLLETGDVFHHRDPRIKRGDPESEQRAGWRYPGSLMVPITWNGTVLGGLCAYRRSIRAWSSDTVQLGLLYAGQVAAALQNARLYDAVRNSDERFRALIRGVSDVITIVRADGIVEYASPASISAWGIDSEELIGQTMAGAIHPDERTMFDDLLVRVRRQPGATVTGVLRLYHPDQDWRDFELILSNMLDDRAVNGIVVTYHDVTERKAFEQQLSRLAYRDPLSALPNRVLFMERLASALRKADREGRSVGVLFVDLDNFKIVNDSLGHEAGDAVLTEVASRLQRSVRGGDTAARLGGDEFTVLMESIADAETAIAVAERIRSALEAPIHLPAQDVFAGASIGIAISTPGKDGPEELLRKADLAMYHAKTTGKARHALFESGLHALAQERLALETDLRRALERGELRVFYQPIVSLSDERIDGLEALVRWEHPRRGLVGPNEFIPLAEETGLIVPLGRWVLEHACRQVATWQRTWPSLQLSVNLSARQFQDPRLVEDVARALEQSGLTPKSLILEITETAVMLDAHDAIRKLESLKAMDLRLAIDDFGTGYSSLSQLTRFPVDTLKIDRSFVDGMQDDGHHVAIVRSILALADGLGLSVTAEGIETREQMRMLRTAGCQRGQGYLFSRPVSCEEAAGLLGEDLLRAA